MDICNHGHTARDIGRVGTMCGSGIFWLEVAMHLIILLILFVALAAIIIWVADWTSGPRSS